MVNAVQYVKYITGKHCFPNPVFHICKSVLNQKATKLKKCVNCFAVRYYTITIIRLLLTNVIEVNSEKVIKS